ncbi:hypothetical protein CR513_01507, partial [Mucuna pruriens]
MFQILAQTNVVVTTLANQNATSYAQVGYTMGPLPRNARDPPYGMPPVDEEQEQQNKVNNGPVFNANSGTGPNPKDDPRAQYQTLGNPPPSSEEKWKSLEERLRAIEGGDKYGLEVVDLCLVPDVGLLTNFKTPEFDKYKGSSCPRVHLAMYCRKMAAYIYDDKVLIHCFQDSLTRAALS